MSASLLLPGELQAPPSARLYPTTPFVIRVIEKPASPVEGMEGGHPRTPLQCAARAFLALTLLSGLFLLGSLLLPCGKNHQFRFPEGSPMILYGGHSAVSAPVLSFNPQNGPTAMARPSIPALQDPLENLLSTFLSQLVEPPLDLSCLACFFNDSSRVRRSPGAPAEGESFLMYRSDPGLVGFQVFTHVFRAYGGETQAYSTDSPEGLVPVSVGHEHRNWFGFPINPFDFFTSNDEQASQWEPVPVSYFSHGSSQGWEKGEFRGEPPGSRFLKITLNDMGGSTWRPQIGEVQINHEQ